MSSTTQHNDLEKVKHNVFVIGADGEPLTPTTRAKARKLIKGGVACITWDKFGRFGIQLLTETRKITPLTILGDDPGGKYDGSSVVCGKENVLSVKWDLPGKKKIVDKITERYQARHTRNSRKRCRPARFNNRKRDKNWLAPSQRVVVLSRIKRYNELCRIYPITIISRENVAFNHAKYRWGKYFTTAEIGKTVIKEWFINRGIEVKDYQGYETKEIREQLGYKKSSSKKADCFNAHCSDSLALAVEAGDCGYVEPGAFIAVDDRYRCVRRKIHDSNIKKGGVREKYSKGTVNGLSKGIMIGTSNGNAGFLCGEYGNSFRYYDLEGKRNICKKISWVSRKLRVKL